MWAKRNRTRDFHHESESPIFQFAAWQRKLAIGLTALGLAAFGVPVVGVLTVDRAEAACAGANPGSAGLARESPQR